MGKELDEFSDDELSASYEAYTLLLDAGLTKAQALSRAGITAKMVKDYEADMAEDDDDDDDDDEMDYKKETKEEWDDGKDDGFDDDSKWKEEEFDNFDDDGDDSGSFDDDF